MTTPETEEAGMKLNIILVVGAALLAGCAMGAAEPADADPPQGLVWMALSDVNEAVFDHDDPFNSPPLATAPPEGMIRAVDVSPDGKPDWLIDYEAAGVNAFCGTGGCLRRLYVSDGDEYVRALDAQVLALEIGQGASRTLTAQVHAIYCKAETTDCRYIYQWDAQARRLAPDAATDGRIADGEAFQPITPAQE